MLGAMVSETLGFRIDASQNIADLGLDSVTAMILISRIAAVFQVELTFEDPFSERSSVSDLASAIDRFHLQQKATLESDCS